MAYHAGLLLYCTYVSCVVLCIESFLRGNQATLVSPPHRRAGGDGRMARIRTRTSRTACVFSRRPRESLRLRLVIADDELGMGRNCRDGEGKEGERQDPGGGSRDAGSDARVRSGLGERLTRDGRVPYSWMVRA